MDIAAKLQELGLELPSAAAPAANYANAAVDGDFSKIKRLVKLGGFVQAVADFKDQPEVINGASDLFVEVLGDAGRHARFAVSAADLPRGVAVEIDAIFELV